MSDLQKATGIPWGPLDTHIRALSSKGYVSTRKILTPFEPRTLVQLTDKGLRSYEELLSKLEEYVRLKRWVVERKTML